MDATRFAAMLVPARCPLCREAIDPGALICGRCVGDLNRTEILRGDPPAGVDRIASCADHSGTPRELLAAFKFGGHVSLAELITGFMADVLPPVERGLLVAVPPARLRTRLRGFDPVALLTAGLSRTGGMAVPGRPVLLRRGSGRQRGRGRAGRVGDPPDIRPTPDCRHGIQGRNPVLVDDVMTTGATLEAAAAALRSAGAASVSAVTFTRRI